MNTCITRRSAVLLSAAILFATVNITPALASPADDAKASAIEWLSLIDHQQYAQSWTEASAVFRGHITQENWASSIKSALEPLGALVSREITGVTMSKALPGAPDGNYAVIRAKTVFKNKAQALETVTLELEDGKWKTAGYFVR